MNQEAKIRGLESLGMFIKQFLGKKEEDYTADEEKLSAILRRSEIENPWFTQENLRLSLESWATILKQSEIKEWLFQYTIKESGKRVGLILAGNIPLVGFHDIICVVLADQIPVIKLSSKDRLLIPFLMEKWNEFSNNEVKYELVEKLDNFDSVIATGSNNTARYLEFYFKDYPNIIRKNRTSVAVLTGNESDAELKLLAKDIFQYFGLGCRNVTRIFVPKDFALERLFENFGDYQDVINHHKYANNYDYNRAIYLLNKENFWDNNFVMLRESQDLFGPLSVVNFSRYENFKEVEDFLQNHAEEIQCVVSDSKTLENAIPFGDAQNPSISTYADQVDTMEFLTS